MTVSYGGKYGMPKLQRVSSLVVDWDEEDDEKKEEKDVGPNAWLGELQRHVAALITRVIDADITTVIDEQQDAVRCVNFCR